MANKLSSSDVSEITRQSDVTSKPLRDNYTNIKNKINELIDEFNALSTAASGAEITQSRPYHSSLKDRLDSIWKGQNNYIKYGGVVTINGGDPQKVDVTAGEAKNDGIDTKWIAATSATISYTSANTRYDIVAVENDSTLVIVTGAESATPVLPTIAQSQKPLWVLSVGTATLTLGWDARNQGAYYTHDGSMKYKWYIQDAIDDIAATESSIIYIGDGTYLEEIDISGKNNITLDLHTNAIIKRKDASSYCIKSVNTVSNETTGIKIIGGKLEGNSQAGAIELMKIDYTDEFLVTNTRFDGNASSTASKKNFVITNSDRFSIRDIITEDGSGNATDTNYSINSSTEYSFYNSTRAVISGYDQFWMSKILLDGQI